MSQGHVLCNARCDPKPSGTVVSIGRTSWLHEPLLDSSSSRTQELYQSLEKQRWCFVNCRVHLKDYHLHCSCSKKIFLKIADRSISDLLEALGLLFGIFQRISMYDLGMHQIVITFFDRRLKTKSISCVHRANISLWS